MAAYRPSDWHVLDLEGDPVPGDPEQVKQLARKLHAFADDVGDALRDIKGMAGEDAMLRWAGKSAEAFTSEFEDVPKNLRKLKKSYDLAGDALAKYWPELEKAQADSLRALEKGRQARKDLSSANGRLDSANDWVKRAEKKAKEYEDEGKKKDVPPPDEKDVRAATRNATNAGEAKESAQSAVDSANSALAAAKRMAEDARKLREDAASACKKKLEEASDAGIQNRSWWEEGVDWVSDNWDTIVTVCKVVVAVVGIVAMIIGGPILGAIVLVAALVVLADTLHKYANGEASLWDVAFAALDCIPGMKGLTTLGGLAKGLKGLAAGGLKGMADLAKGARSSLQQMSKQMKKRLCKSDPVDVVTGEMVLPQTDVQLEGELPLLLTRTHVSSYRSGRWFGPSWASVLDQRLEIERDGVVFVAEDGMLLHYPIPDASSPVFPLAGPRWPLTWDGDQYGLMQITVPEDRTTYSFAPGPPSKTPVLEAPIRAVRDRNGNELAFRYDAAGVLTELRHSGGYRIGVETGNGRVTGLSLLSRDGGTTPLRRYGYDPAGNLREVLHPGVERPLRFSYDDDGRMTAWNDRNGYTYTYTYDSAGRCVATSGTDGFLNGAFAYSEAARTTTYTDSLGFTTTFEYNELLQVERETDALGAVTATVWNSQDQPVSVTDPLGRVTRFAYDGAGHRTATFYPDGKEARAVYDPHGRPVEITDVDGSVWRQEFDERGNLVRAVDPAGGVTEYVRDEHGRLTAVTDAAGGTRSVACDAAGLPVRVVSPQGGETRYERDAAGRVIALTDPADGTMRMTWNTDGRLLSRTLPSGATEEWCYDGEGNVTRHTGADGQVTVYEYAAFDVLSARTYPEGERQQFTYDTQLRMTSVTNSQGHVWSYEYDAVGNLVSETDFSGRTYSYRYDATGRLVTRINGAGQVTEYERDLAGNLVEEIADGELSRFTYDSRGFLVEAVNDVSRVVFERNEHGSVLRQTSNGRQLVNGYDAYGRRVLRRTPSGVESRWEYDRTHLPAVMRSGGVTVTFEHDKAGRETERRFGDHLLLGQTWDSDHQLVEQHLRAPGAKLSHRRSFSYRPSGTMSGIDSTRAGESVFETDMSGRITAVTGPAGRESYAYDPSGNQLAADWTPRGEAAPQAVPSTGEREYDRGRLTRAGRVRYVYDAQGRVTRRVHKLLSGGSRAWEFTWDARDRLTEVTRPDGERWRYEYDALGRRIAKYRLGADGGVDWREEYIWDEFVLAERLTTVGGTGARAARNATVWEWEPHTHRPVAQIQREFRGDSIDQQEFDDRFFAIVTDLIGTPSEIVDESGETVWRQKFSVWGAPRAEDDTNAQYPLRFPGQYFDAETGLHYNFHRYYDPETARYFSSDPLGLAPAKNPYAYVPNPFTWSDPAGLAPCDKVPLWRLLMPGPYAVESIPARSTSQRFTDAERDAIDRIGDYFGCHSCGSPDPGVHRNGNPRRWTPDHQPVSRLAPDSPQRLYPHCHSCSSRQGGLVGHMPGGQGVPDLDTAPWPAPASPPNT